MRDGDEVSDQGKPVKVGPPHVGTEHWSQKVQPRVRRKTSSLVCDRMGAVQSQREPKD